MYMPLLWTQAYAVKNEYESVHWSDFEEANFWKEITKITDYKSSSWSRYQVFFLTSQANTI